MTVPFHVEITDLRAARRFDGKVLAGRHFLFVEMPAGSRSRRPFGRKKRLQLPEGERRTWVHALSAGKLRLPGMWLTASSPAPEPLAAVVADRDLYRAEEDTAHLLVVLPSAPEGAQLVVECDGQPFAERELSLSGGVDLVPLAALLPGSYRAVATAGGRTLGAAAEFTVAEYSLAPLGARLLEHEADRESETLSFLLDVESWQQPCREPLEVTLLDGARPVESVRLEPAAPGRYRGALRMEGEGPFRLEARVEADPGRVATVTVSGTRRAERETTVLGELGREALFSLLPEPAALPVRGGFLTEGDRLTTPLTVDAVLTDEPRIDVHAEASDLQLLVFDLVTGESRLVEHGAASEGDSIPVENPSGLALVVVGGIVNGKPFEGFTTFVRPGSLEVRVTAPETVRPRDEMTVAIEVDREGPVPVLLSVRDRRLTRTDTPATALGASFKRGVEAATEGMAESGIEPVALGETLFPPPSRYRRAGMTTEPLYFEEVEQFVEEGVFVECAAPPDEAAEIGAAPGAPPPRAEFPPVLFVGLVEVDGRAEVTVPTGDGTGSFVVCAFACAGGDWNEAVRDLVVDQPVRADLEVPPTAHPGDDVGGRLRVAAASGLARVGLTRDGTPVALRGGDGAEAGPEVAAPALLTFPVEPGEYVARVEDAESGEADSVCAVVRVPGRLRTHARELILLTAGESICLEDAGALTLRVLPGLDEPFGLLVDATASYAHLCCEQTAAKILSAAAMYLSATDDGKRSKAEGIIRAGVDRERKMFRPGAGFRMYPDSDHVSDHYSSLAARYLWTLDGLGDVEGLSSGLRSAVVEGLRMADDAGAHHDLERVPAKPEGLSDAHAALARGGDREAALAAIDRLVDFRGGEVRLRNGHHAVEVRAGLAWAAAGLLAAGDLERGLRAANVVVRQLDENGGLYSTVDSVAAIALLIQLRRRRVLSGVGRVRVNGEELDVREAVEMGDAVESVEVLEGTVAVQALAIREEDWTEYGADFPVRVGLREEGDRRPGALEPGRRVDLVVGLEEGYRVGDLVHVDLPACLSWLRGGGLVKRFSVDFEGRDEVRIPLAVTAAAPGGQRYAVCVRNMFEEERRASPGRVRVVTSPA